MAELGRNVRISLGRTQRQALRALMDEVFSCALASPNDGMDIYTFSDGSHLGAQLVPDDSALSPEQLKHGGAWLEISVEDLDAALAGLSRHGIAPFEYVDTEHHYIQLPGGQVLRLCTKEEADR
jgi:hypothetical protein